jgi:hypothetical protein
VNIQIVGYEVSFANTISKTINTHLFSVKGINAVDDVVSIKTVKGIDHFKLMK